MEQSHKTNPIIQEWFVPLSNSPSLSHSVFCGIICSSASESTDGLFLGGGLCSKSPFCSILRVLLRLLMTAQSFLFLFPERDYL